MLLADVFTSFKPAYGDTWPDAFEYLYSDPVESLTVDELCKALAADGSFVEPVRLDVESGVVGNGMHRLAAASKVGLVEVPVSFSDSAVGEVTVLSFTGPPVSQDDDLVFRVLRSFPWTDHPPGAPVWLEAHTLSVSCGRFEVGFMVPAVFANELCNAVSSRLAQYGWLMFDVSASSHDWSGVDLATVPDEELDALEMPLKLTGFSKRRTELPGLRSF